MVTKFLDKLRNKRVLIVGGSSGIGYGIAEGCLEFGAIVTIASRSQSKVDSAVAKLQKTYPEHAANITGHAIALSDSPEIEDELQKLFDFATDHKRFKLDHVVETAGDVGLMGQVNMDTVTPSLLSLLARDRLVGVTMLAKVAIRYMAPAAGSSFTMTSGALVNKPRKGLAPVIGIGAAKEGLTRGLALDMAPVRVNLVSPGAVETDLLFRSVPVAADAGEDEKEAAKDKMREMYAQHGLVGKVASVEDLAEAYLGLMKNAFQTGTLVNVEGGYLLK